jgi:hypothetical protein
MSQPAPILRLARYLDGQGRPRELVTLAASGGSLLVVDREDPTGEDSRLLAHLAPDEPPENAELVGADYLRRGSSSRCRALTEEDLLATAQLSQQPTASSEPAGELPPDRAGRVHSLELVDGRASIPDLRWVSRSPDRRGACEVVSLREAVGKLERYEPLCGLTERALAAKHDDPAVSTTVLRAELRRVRESPIVLNRRLREVVLERVASGGSMSEIAMRCGRTKRDRRGNESGETLSLIQSDAADEL